MSLSVNEQRVFDLIKKDPFLSQQAIAETLNMNRSTVATVIASLTNKKQLLGRAYVVNSAATIYCIGGMNLDRKFHLEHTLIPQTSNPAYSTWSVGGVARNISENLGRLEQHVALLSVAGFDQDYETIKQTTQHYVDLQHIEQLAQHNTSTYTAILDGNGDMQLALADMGICDEMTAEWIKRYETLLKEASLIIIDLNVPRETVEYVIQFSKQHAITLMIVSVSAPKMQHLPLQLDGVDWLVTNLDESQAFFNSQEDGDILCQRWIDSGVQHVIMTQGKHPLLYKAVSEALQQFIPPTVERVIDVTGAGDSFAAGLAYGISKEYDPITAIQYGLTNSYWTIQSPYTVRDTLSESQFEQEMITLMKEGK